MSSLITRARSLSVLGIVAAAALGLIAATQPWFLVTLTDGSAEAQPVAGANGISVLSPLILAALAMGLALSIVGNVLRQIFAAIGVVISLTLIVLTVGALTGSAHTIVAPTITKITGITGEASIEALIASVSTTAWPIVALVCWIVLLVATLFALATAHRWRSAGKKYSTSAETHTASAGPLDAIDSWDDLSRGDDPTR